MSENNKSGISAWVSGLIGFLVGLFIGLVILGWWLWPVQWSNGAVEILAPEPKAEFLRAAIDSYAYQPDQALARQRFTALGRSGPYVLSTIYEPGVQGAADIEAFAAAVGATAALENPPAAPPAPLTPELALGRAIASPLTLGLLCGAALLILLIVLLLILRRNRKKAGPAPAFAPMQAETAAEDTAPVHLTAAPATSSAEPTGQLPDWLQEGAPQELETIQLAETGLEPLEGEELREIDLLGGEAEQSLTDEDFDAITSSPFIEEAEEQELPEFMRAETGAAAAAILAGEALETEAELAEAPAEAQEILAVAAAEEPESIPLESQEAEAGGLIEITESHEEAHAKFSQDIQTVAGIGPVYAEKLRAAGIIAPLLLLRNGVTAKGRQQIAEQTGISEKMILKWVNFVDLFRIKGVDELYAELLEAAGVDTVPELATRNPNNLHARLLEVIEQKRPSRTPPELWMVEDWIAQAKKLPRAIHY